jgi:hypothetical protein
VIGKTGRVVAVWLAGAAVDVDDVETTCWIDSGALNPFR